MVDRFTIANAGTMINKLYGDWVRYAAFKELQTRNDNQADEITRLYKFAKENDKLTGELERLRTKLAEGERSNKEFPILGDNGNNIGKIPWWVAEQAYMVYANKYGDQQSLERLAERGGFGINELNDFLPDWKSKCSLIAQLQADLTASKEKLLAISQAGGFPPWMGQEIANKDKRIAELEGALENCKTAIDKLVYNSELMDLTVGVPEGKVAQKIIEQALNPTEKHTFVNDGLIYRCSKCGWTFEVPPNENQQIVILRKRRKYECPLTEETKQKYNFITT